MRRPPLSFFFPSMKNTFRPSGIFSAPRLPVVPEVFVLGAVGCIRGFVDLVPGLMVALDRMRRLNQPGQATAGALSELVRIIDQLTFPLNVAAGLEVRSFDPGVPKAIGSPETRAIYTRLVGEVRAFYERCGLALAATARS
jgi:hypothetical protein